MLSEAMTTADVADVAIVGCGPVGQALALWLAQVGHRVTLIERHLQPYALPRAVTYDDEVARIFDRLGLSEELVSLTEAPTSYQWRNARRELLLQLDWNGPGPSGWPRGAMFCQPELEALMMRRIERLPQVQLFRGVVATALHEDAEGVDLELRSADADARSLQHLRARYVIGTDGANSFVRSAIGAQMQDLGFSADWLVVDVLPRQPGAALPGGAGSWQLCDPQRPTTLVSGGPGRRRWEFMALAHETLDQLNSVEVAWKLLAPWGVTPDNARLERHAVYRFKGGLADRWHRGRVFIAGDAAHLMPPFAGQGLCAGIRDVAALGWRLDLALRGLGGGTDGRLLNSYGSERAPHAAYWIGFAIELGKVICVLDPDAAAQRDAAMQAALRDPTLAPPPPPPPRLGPDGLTAAQPHAGLLSVQGVVERQGRRGLFDQVIGRGFALIARGFDPAAALSSENARFWQRLGGVTAWLDDRDCIDCHGTYTRWLGELGADAALVRPDFYLYGLATSAGEVNALVDALRLQLQAPHAVAAT